MNDKLNRAKAAPHRSPTAAVALFVLALQNACAPPAGEAPPELILYNAHVMTMDASATVAEAIAVDGREIVAIGSSDDVRRLAGPETELVDAGGNSVTPGIIDTHNHFAWAVSSNLAQLELEYPAVTRIDDVREQLRAAVAAEPPGTWITGWRWDAAKLAEQRDIVAADLDDLSPDHPVWLGHTSGHYGVANSRAMSLAGIDADMPDPDGGVIARDADGIPTGILTDQAMDLINAVLPPATTDDYVEAITRYVGDLSAEGITAIKDPEIYQAHYDAYRTVERNGDLTVRVFTLWRAPDTLPDAVALRDRIAPFTAPQQQDGSALVVSGGVKIYVDGSGTARTAWMHDDWNRDFTGLDAGNTGLTYLDPPLLEAQIRLFHEAGIHIGTHAIGDRAIDFTLDTYAQVLEDRPTYGLRHSIIHCNLPTGHALELMLHLQRMHDAAYPEVQPAFLWWIGDVYVANFGPERSRRVLPLRTFGERGIRWAGSSDYDVSPYAPRHAFRAALTREPMLGTWGDTPWGSEESVPLHETLRAYTATASRQVFLEHRIGTLETGKLADIVLWNQNLDETSADELDRLRAVLTMMNGRIVHRAGE